MQSCNSSDSLYDSCETEWISYCLIRSCEYNMLILLHKMQARRATEFLGATFLKGTAFLHNNKANFTSAYFDS